MAKSIQENGFSSKQEVKVELYSADDFRTLIPDGEYWAECTEHEFKYFDKSRQKLFLQFDIMMDGDGGIESVFMAFNLPNNGRIGSRSNYYKTWCMVHGGKPSRNAKLSPRTFKNKFFKIRTRTVTTHFDGEKRTPDRYYSVVDEILKVTKKT